MKIGEFITSIAVCAFMLSLCTIEANIPGSLAVMFISSVWLVAHGWWREEDRREREGRR